ncbi:MAG TPA: nucleotidyl transferase AbiEii/AbiGii toxin family protein [Fimbriimonadaceae bacterium]|nr:nucleotidyl transferase AbiEii/AbiGii toxin family protein [Fimbriimonadaceae bacterium]
MPVNPNLENALSRLNAAATDLGLSYAIIGGLAVILRGHDRGTRDVDAVVLDLDDHLDSFLSSAKEHGLTLRIDDGRAFAKDNRVILLQAPDSTEVDVSMGILPFEVEVASRANTFEVGENLTVPVATVEDLLIMKFVAGRKRDYEDVESLLELYPNIDKDRVQSVVTEYGMALDDDSVIDQMKSRLTPNP